MACARFFRVSVLVVVSTVSTLSLRVHWLSCAQYRRCTVGRINWVPEKIETDPALINSFGVLSSERRVAVHELMHVLGMLFPRGV
jgi:hypothetical protein